MRTERTRDRIILTPQEVQTILREHIEKASGRKIDGDVLFQQENASVNGARTSAYVHLHYKDEDKI